MDKEEKNQLVRQGKVTVFASIPLSAEILGHHVKSIGGVAHVPKSDFDSAMDKGAADLMAFAEDPQYAEVYVDHDVAKSIILSMGVVQRRDPRLFDGTLTDEQRDARKRSLKAHTNAHTAAQDMKKEPTVEKFENILAGFDDGDLVRRMLCSQTASSKVITLEGKRLEPIDFPTRKLNSETNHQVRIVVDEVAASGTHAMVTIKGAKNPHAVALDGLLNRSVRLNFKGFDMIPHLADMLLSLRLAKHEAEILVSVTRAIRDSDKDLDQLTLKEFLGLRELVNEGKRAGITSRRGGNYEVMLDCQRCGSNSSICAEGSVGSLVSTSLR